MLDYLPYLLLKIHPKQANTFSRYEPHKKLKRFLSPAFTVAYIENLEFYFQHTMRALLTKYQDDVRRNSLGNTPNSPGFSADLMEDLHNVALDM